MNTYIYRINEYKMRRIDIIIRIIILVLKFVNEKEQRQVVSLVEGKMLVFRDWNRF